MKKILIRLISITLVFAVLATLYSCFESHTRTLPPSVDVELNVPDTVSDDFLNLYSDFSAEFLLRAIDISDEGNIAVSPISLLAVLTMVSQGAEGETRTQFEELFGMSVEEYSKNIGTYLAKLNNTDQANTANSIWIRDSFEVKQSFVNDCGKYFTPDIYVSPFDQTTLNDINNWADDKTDGLIKEILEKIDPAAVMYLMNAVLFDAKWEDKYEESAIVDCTFTNSKGETSVVEMLASSEYKYLEGDGYVGFAKDYEGGEYSFMALLPNEGSSPEALLETINGDLYNTLNRVLMRRVNVYMPRFKSQNTLPLTDMLKDMGLTDAFDPWNADFSGISKDKIYLSFVLQKTYIELDENGTKAAAVTIGGEETTSEAPRIETIVLDRPYVYAIVHNETGLPVFVGITNNVE